MEYVFHRFLKLNRKDKPCFISISQVSPHLQEVKKTTTIRPFQHVSVQHMCSTTVSCEVETMKTLFFQFCKIFILVNTEVEFLSSLSFHKDNIQNVYVHFLS